jgi:GDPmannose 4,6-dehydratase
MSIYGVSKVFSYHTSIYYRDAYGIFACNGILFNHESPRRGPTFVTKKIIQAFVRIKNNKQKCLITW